MNRFDCEDCVLNGTDACRYGSNKSNDYSDICPDLLVEQNHAYEKGIIDGAKNIAQWLEDEWACHGEIYPYIAEDAVNEWLEFSKEQKND